MAETTTAMVKVRANSRNMRPTMPVMNRSGMNTAISDTVSEITVKPISRAPRNAASSADSPCSMWRTMFSIITIASSTTKPVPMVSAISDRLSRLKPQNHITHQGADRAGCVVHDGELDVGRHGALQPRQLAFHQLHGLDHVGAGLALHVDDDRRHALVPAADLGVFQIVEHDGDVGEQDRR